MRWALAGVLLALLPRVAGAVDTPTASEMMQRVGFGSDDQKQVLAGQLVEGPLDTDSDRELAVALAFLVKKTPAELLDLMVARALIIATDPKTLAEEAIPAEASIDDFAKLTLGADEVSLYANAQPGESVNLSPTELERLRSAGPGKAAVEDAMRRVLMERYRAYRAGGLAGVAPYARGGGQMRDVAAELQRAADDHPRVAQIDADLARFLRAYPKASLPGYSEAFHWSHYEAHGEPTLILTHTFGASLGGARMLVRRQFYVSRGYDVEQAIAAFVPVAEGTLVVYWNHTFTDQVAGFGSGMKRTVGERVMGRQLEDLFEKLQQAADGS